MAEAVQAYFEKVLASNDGLLAIIISDRDGVPLVKATAQKVPQNALRASFLATFATAAEQASKLGLSKNRSIVCMFPSFQVVHFNYLPLVVSAVATSQANTGFILSLEDDFREAVNGLKVAVEAIQTS